MRLFPLFALVALVGCGLPLSTPDASMPGDDAAAASDAGPRSDAATGPDASSPDAGRDPIGETVTTDLGDVRGTLSDELAIFKGIPYAAPPVDALRLRRPAPHPGWSDVRDATVFGPPCPQMVSGAPGGAEDCLTLNVWAPRAAGPRPVMVFIHGGAFVGGSGSDGIYDGTNLAERGDVVLITINYRLGALGFLASEELAAGESDGAVGNYGSWDQIAALEWVQRNAAAFGGDPARVMVFGESAGAMSVCVLLGAPAADGLFSRALAESGGGCHGFEEPRTPRAGGESMMERHAHMIERLGCAGEADVPVCLRALPMEAFVEVAQAETIAVSTSIATSIPYAPNVDGVLLEEDPYDRIASGDRPDVPIVIGSNADESFIFTLTDFIITPWQYEQRVREIAGENADAILAAYPVSDFTGPKDAWNALASDAAFICPALSLAEAAAPGSAPAFNYHYTHVLGGICGTGGAIHAAELVLVFGNYPSVCAARTEDIALEAVIQHAWTSFAHDGAPTSLPPWPPYAPGTESIAVLAQPLSMTGEIRAGRCDALRSIGVVP